MSKLGKLQSSEFMGAFRFRQLTLRVEVLVPCYHLVKHSSRQNILHQKCHHSRVGTEDIDQTEHPFCCLGLHVCRTKVDWHVIHFCSFSNTPEVAFETSLRLTSSLRLHSTMIPF
jgi:hypothetical protein